MRDDGAGVFLQHAGLIQRWIEARGDEAAVPRLRRQIAREGGSHLVREGAQARLVGECERGAGGGDLGGGRVLRRKIRADFLADAQAGGECGEVARASPSEGEAHPGAFDVTGALEGVAGEVAAVRCVKEEGDGVEALFDFPAVAGWAAEAVGQQAGAGGCDGTVDGCDERALARAPR